MVGIYVFVKKAQVAAMQYQDLKNQLQLELTTKGFEIPDDERTRMQLAIERIAQELKGLTSSKLWITIHHHPKNPAPFHVEAKLRLPEETFKTSDWDQYLDAAFQRTARKLIRKIEWSREQTGVSIPAGCALRHRSSRPGRSSRERAGAGRRRE